MNPLGRSAAEFISISINKRFFTSCVPLDRLLGDGLPSGHILELSGPPGTAKEALAAEFVSSAVSLNDQVLFVDMQNMTSPASLGLELCSKNLVDTDFDLTRLVILNSIWFPFRTFPGLTQSRRAILLARVKQVLARLCSSRDISVVITTQLATKLLTPDGSPASFDTGSRAVLVPQLGSDYLPPHRSFRVLIVPETRTSGVLRLLSSPSCDDGSTISEESYEMEGNRIGICESERRAPIVPGR
ncbi:hypothetical protein B0F90DRAFT_1725289 [Multifurca ochricompacta]|uniref:RecA family profile 1 domain-containing protein n=1 Tax=Multifurca ochricompacta TaxID=376703 RepID=A0AAD4QN85_9AGAM|nr:hypothetical protein B0F90DRAFT_1725289 [Multifurca ochricompacta]